MSDNNEPELQLEQDFAAVLLGHAGGRAHSEASRKFAEVVKAVQETGKKGTVTVTLTVTRNKDTRRMVKLVDTVRASIPVEDRPGSLWFPDSHGALHRNDPDQHEIEFNQVQKLPQEGK